MKEAYKTIEPFEESILFKDKNSKFFGFIFHVETDGDIKNALHEVKKQHPQARHICYAYQIGIDQISFKANDDGEPNYSAGMPIYNQIKSYEITNVLIAVVRYFGGTKLGISGLINAYKTTAKEILDKSNIITKKVEIHIVMNCSYNKLSILHSIINTNEGKIYKQELLENCTLYVQFPIALQNLISDKLVAQNIEFKIINQA